MVGVDEIATPPRKRRWWLVILVVVLAVLAGLYVAATVFVRPLVERALTDALAAPVTIGHLWWRPFAGEVVAGNVSIGSGGDRVFVDALAVEIPLASIVRREIAIDRIAIEAPAATLRFDSDYRLVSPFVTSAPKEAEAAAKAAPPAPLPQIGVRELVVTNGRIVLVYPLGDKTHEGTVDITRLVASDITTSADGSSISARAVLEGAIDGAPVNADTVLHIGGAERLVDGKVSISGFLLSRDVLPLPQELASLSGSLDATASYESKPKSGTPLLKLDLHIKQPQLAGTENTKLVARSIALPKVVIDPEKGQIDLGAIKIEALEFDAALTDTGVVLPFGAAEKAPREQTASTGAPWKVVAGAIDAKGGEVRIHRGDLVAELAIVSARLDGYTPGKRKPLALEARGVRTLPPQLDRPAEILAVHEATAELTFDPKAAPPLEITSLKLAYPYVMVQRHTDDVFPYSLWISSDGAQPPPAAEPPPSTAALAVQRLSVEGGKLEFMDMTLTPPYWTALSELTFDAEGVRLPPPSIDHFHLAARYDELSPVDVSGSLGTKGLEAKAELEDVLLESMNAYVSPLLGYRVVSGRMSMSAVARPSASSLQSVIELVLRGVDVLQTGTDVIQSQSGVPLPVALSLISNAAGQIDLTLPISMDTTTGELSFGSLVGQAVKRAIVGALTSPLRILGSLFGTNGAPHAFAVAPVPFETGSAKLDDAGRTRIDEIARILEKHQGLLIVTLPQITDADVAEVGAADAKDLADDRQAAVGKALLKATGLESERLMPTQWKPKDAAAATGKPGVYIELQDAP